jgi:hypothetical protein
VSSFTHLQSSAIVTGLAFAAPPTPGQILRRRKEISNAHNRQDRDRRRCGPHEVESTIP